MIGAVGFSGERLCFGDRPGRLQQIVEPANLRQVDGENVVPEKIAQRAIHPLALHVPGRVERDDAGVHVVEQDIEVRRPRLVHVTESFSFLAQALR